MKLFHISDVLTVTTGRLVSNRHMDGVYDILNFLTGDELFTHQLPRASDECKPRLRTQFPQLMEDSPGIPELCEVLKERIETCGRDKEKISAICDSWCEEIRQRFGLPEMLPVYELGAEMHTHIDPVQELESMVGKNRVIVVNPEEER